MTGEEQFTEAEIDEWDCDIDHLIGEARVSEDAYLYALGARCERLANLWDDVQDIIDDIRTGGKQCL